MKIKVRNKIYDGEEEPIMLILSNKDKENIMNMAIEATKYCEWPRELFTKSEIDDWMGEI